MNMWQHVEMKTKFITLFVTLLVEHFTIIREAMETLMVFIMAVVVQNMWEVTILVQLLTRRELQMTFLMDL